jgi:hypothetical protein
LQMFRRARSSMWLWILVMCVNTGICMRACRVLAEIREYAGHDNQDRIRVTVQEAVAQLKVVI